LQNAGIIRNRAKIEAAINNANIFLDIQKEYGSFAQFIWSFVNGKQIQNQWKTLKEVPATTAISDELAKTMKKKGFKFLGSTTLYAHMQAVGMVNDHLVSCPRYVAIKKEFGNKQLI
jgi:DNA-3-methyladenine glycosylase I